MKYIKEELRSVVPDTGFKLVNYYTLEVVYLLLFSLIVGYFGAYFFSFLAAGKLVMLTIFCLLTLLVFTLLIYINNRRFSSDKNSITGLIASRKLGSLELVVKFHQQIKQRIEILGESYYGTTTEGIAQSSGIDEYLVEIFGKENGMIVFRTFIQTHGNPVMFLHRLDDVRKEILFRHLMKL